MAPSKRPALFLCASLALLMVLFATSLLIGAGGLSPAALLGGGEEGTLLLLASRLPRTLALVLTGASMAVAGMIMQLIARNRFAEPSTAGTVESAGLGMLAASLLAPGAPIVARMLVAAAFAFAGTCLFLALLRRIPLRSPLVVPLVGLMLGGVINALATFIAYRYDLMQALRAWSTGDFSAVLRGRYEMLWLALGLTALSFVAAERFTAAGLGRDFATNIGVNYRRVVAFGLAIVAMVTALVVATIGMIPFLGLIVPNIVSLIMGDNMRRAVPFVAISGTIFVLACDIIGRVLRYPFEIPVGVVMGVVGSGVFLLLLLRRGHRAV